RCAKKDRERPWGTVKSLTNAAMKRKTENRGFAGIDSPPIYECRAFYKCVVDALLQLIDVVNLKDDRIGRRAMHSCHACIWIVQMRHAVDPSIEITTVEIWKTECLGEDVVKCVPVNNPTRVYPHNWHLNERRRYTAPAISAIFCPPKPKLLARMVRTFFS